MSNLIYKKILAINEDLGAIEKSQTNSGQGYKFRGIDQFLNALNPLLLKHGVFISPRCTSYTSELKDVTRANGKQAVDKHASILIEYDFIAEDGSKVTIGAMPGEGLDSGDKATTKALSAALKYALIQMFAVPTQDMIDSDSESPEIGMATYKPSTEKVVTEPQITRLVAICKKNDWSKEALNNHMANKYKKHTARSLNQVEYDELCNYIEASKIIGDALK